MDPIPVPGAAPAAVGADKVPETVVATTSADTKPMEPVATETKPAEEKKDEREETAPVPETSAAPLAEPAKLEEPPALAPPADAPAASKPSVDAPKPASIEEVPDQDGPVAMTGVQEPKAIPAEQSAGTSASYAEPVKASVEEPIAQEPAKAPVVDDEPVKEPITEKAEAVNGAATKDVEMTGALNDAEPAGAGEREAAPQAVLSEAKVGDKRKADDLVETNGANGTNGVEEAAEEKPAEKKAKRGPGRPPSNGAAKESPKKDLPSKEKESFGHKVARNVKKVIHPVGRTARKTRSQGPV
ncbi:uncharacterized protein ColSpa_00551 [Colletotrichum spaethianum]|uniref:Uncharacterized protein n=1 Tax=Colletotrichum spaethianum TaxID=700344 RepID=A0AA37NVL2_9PEZI|nr:uncharacterized protein ColSpa_00551 [Colletotrichum spaethianum]GKT40370.1 hypothetical protein ColSpa_00551 [Colletotrichum spaethianum]